MNGIRLDESEQDIAQQDKKKLIGYNMLEMERIVYERKDDGIRNKQSGIGSTKVE